MKKIILTILAMLFAISVVSAKSFGSEGYKGDVSFSYGFGISNTVDNFSFSTTHGYQFTPGFFLGFGGELSVFRDCTFIPIYVATKYFLFSEGRRVAPVLGCRFGYGIFAAADDPVADRLDKGGFYTNPSIGLQFGVGKKDHALELTVGYAYQRISVKYSNITSKAQNIQLRLGFVF